MMIAALNFEVLDWAILAAYFLGMMGLGFYFWRRNRSAEQFTAAGRTLPGWLCGLSIFATYLSSISYLALPGKAFVDNWNAFVFSIALPPAAAVAARFFVPLYRRSGDVSAYAWLEKRFGLWARIFASSFYLLFQIARTGVVMYLMALPMAILFGWDIRMLILITGVVVTAYAFIGGIVAVIWADAIQAIVLLAGALLSLVLLINGVPGNLPEVLQVAEQNQKFSLGSWSLFSISQPTIWVVFAYGIFENLRNFGIDQSYVQRYIAAKDDREAVRGVWIGVWLYVPVSALFLFIGTSLFAFYESHPRDYESVREVVAQQRLMQEGIEVDSDRYAERLSETAQSLTSKDLGDRVFPHFIASYLPVGIRGLLIAAIFSAAMSTVSTSLNSAATLVYSDFYRRLIRRDPSPDSQLKVLRGATICWGILGTGMALTLVSLTESILDVWWTLSSVLGAGVVGLFLTGVMVRRISSKRAIGVLVGGMILIAWMTVSQSDYWPVEAASWASPFHSYLIIVVGPTIMILAASLIAWLSNDHRESDKPSPQDQED